MRTRHSARLAAKEKRNFVDATTKAAQLRALHDSLALCSTAVQAHVTQKKLMNKRKKPIAGVDLAKLATAVGLGRDTARALDSVLAIGATTSNKLDTVLNATNV